MTRENSAMNVLTVYAHPNPTLLCHAILERFTRGLEDAGHKNGIVDLYNDSKEGQYIHNRGVSSTMRAATGEG